MIRSVGVWALAALVVSTSAAAHSTAHEHGRSRMQVAIDTDGIALEWRIPMGEVAGFESQVSTTEQQTKLDAAYERLRASSAAISLEGAGECQIKPVETRLDGPDDHPDILLSVQWSCSSSEALSAIVFDPWTAVGGHERITVEWLSASGQGQEKWMPPTTRLPLTR